jgi:hypothetical protein
MAWKKVTIFLEQLICWLKKYVLWNRQLMVFSLKKENRKRMSLDSIPPSIIHEIDGVAHAFLYCNRNAGLTGFHGSCPLDIGNLW